MIARLRLLFLIAAIFSLLAALLFTGTGEMLEQARNAYLNGDHDQALRLGRRVLHSPFATRAERAAASLLLARSASENGHPRKALDYLDELVEKQPGLAQAWLLRGKIRQDLGQSSAALSDLEKGFGLVGKEEREALLPYQLAKAQALLAVKGPDEARLQVNKVLSMAPGSPQGHLLSSRLLERLGKSREALAEARKAYELFQSRDASFMFTPAAHEQVERMRRLQIRLRQEAPSP